MLKKKHTLLVLGASGVLSASLPVPVQAQTQTQDQQPMEVVIEVEPREDSFIEAIKAGRVIADYRLRYEGVDDSIHDDARALTGRTRLGYKTGSWGGFKLLGEFTYTNVWNSEFFGVSQYFPEQTGQTGIPPQNKYATVADPGGVALNRAVISYDAWKHGWVGVGRQRIVLDNQRWIGNVGWRQKEQTFDAGSFDVTFGKGWKFSYDYMTRVQGILDKFNRDVSNNIFNLGYTGWNVGDLAFYGYYLADDETKNTNNSVGVRFNGSVKPNNLAWFYTGEYARQHAEFDQTGNKFDVNYYHLMGGIGFFKMSVKVGNEVLGSDGGDYGLLTPLATGHKFNGWADMFLVTPKDGLSDFYVDFGAKWLGAKWGAIYHDFSADRGSDHYGRELDLVIVKPFGEYYSVGFKYADYRADDFSEDRKKAWVWFEFKY